MSTNSSLTKKGWTLVQFLEQLAENSEMSPDTNWEPDEMIWFTATKRYPLRGVLIKLNLDLWLIYSKSADAWFVNRFRVGTQMDHSFRELHQILDGLGLLTHFAKRIAEPDDLKNPSKDLWRITSPSNLEALIREYLNLARIKHCKPVLNLYPQEKDK